MYFFIFDRAPQPFDENIVHETTAFAIEIAMPAASSLPVKAALVNCAP
jgi:hypothetical protein